MVGDVIAPGFGRFLDGGDPRMAIAIPPLPVHHAEAAGLM
jgi:hypothetical protein